MYLVLNKFGHNELIVEVESRPCEMPCTYICVTFPGFFRNQQ